MQTCISNKIEKKSRKHEKNTAHMIEEFHKLDIFKKQTCKFSISEKGGMFHVENEYGGKASFRKKYNKLFDPKVGEFLRVCQLRFSTIEREASEFPQSTRKLYVEKYEGVVFCVDISNAYWDTALKLKYLTPALHERGMQFDKNTRLKALGLTKKAYQTWHFENKEIVREEITENPKSFIYDNCASFVDVTMQHVALAFNRSCIGYYVDCLFFKHERAAIQSVEMLKTLGYKSSFKKCENGVVLHPKTLHLQDFDKKYLF